jgi:hypothetical protein
MTHIIKLKQLACRVVRSRIAHSLWWSLKHERVRKQTIYGFEGRFKLRLSRQIAPLLPGYHPEVMRKNRRALPIVALQERL